MELSPGTRRLAWFIGIPVAALVLGRWTAVFITNRLWESRVSEAASLVGTRFALLAGGLELAGLVIAILWFLGNYLWAVRAAILQFGDLPRPLGGLSERALYLLTGAIAVLVGVAVGGGTGLWLEPVLLAVNGVGIGSMDPLLRVDLGVFLAKLPLWDLLYYRAFSMFVPAATGVVVICLLGGTLGIHQRRLWLSPWARWHLALLLIVAALLIGWSYALSPYRIAADRTASLGPAEFLLRTTVAQVVTILAATAAVASFLWGAKLRATVAVGGWVGLGLGMLGGAILVETRAVEAPLAAAELKTLRPVDTVAFGIHTNLTPTGPLTTDSLGPSLWSVDALTRLAEVDSAKVLGVEPGTLTVGGHRERVWFVLRTPRGGEPVLLAIADNRVGPSGGPVSVRWGDPAFTPGLLPYLALSRHHAMPGAPEFDLDPAASGIALGTPARRIAVGWALQVGAVLRAAPTHRLAWRLDPVRRLQGIAPFVDWTQPRVVVVDRDVYWVSDGFVSGTRFPASRAVPWYGSERRYVRNGFVGVIRARGGEARIYLRANADSLSTTWARIAAPMVEPSTAIPAAIADQLGIPIEAATNEALILQGSGWISRSIARIGRNPYPADQLPNAGTSADPHRIPYLTDDGQRVVGLLVAGSAGSTLTIVDSTRMVAAPKELQQRWDRFPFFQQLRDSIKAAGSEYEPGLIRYAVLGDTLVAYQPNYALGPTGRTALVSVNVAMGPRLGNGRTMELAWLNLRGDAAPAPVGSDLTARLEEARQWLERADAALKRGDLQEFGKAFSYLRELLAPGGSPESPPE